MITTIEPYYTSKDGGFLLYCGDSTELLKKVVRPGTVDMIFADPPYFLSNDGITCRSGKMVSVNKAGWDQGLDRRGIHSFNKKWLRGCRRLLSANGTIWVSGTRHIIYSVGFAMQQIGFKLLNDIVWEKPNPPPNLSCRYFTHSTETVIWAAKDEKSKHRFNYKLMRSVAGGKQMKSVWSIQAPAKSEKKLGTHPTQKPLKLLERIILASSEPGDLVLDPFVGSGTTGVAAVRHGRRFIGIDADPSCLEISKKRYEYETAQMKLPSAHP